MLAVADGVPLGISVAAFVVAAYGTWQAKRSADSAKGSEQHGARSAAAAEASASEARRSADAAERSVAAQEEMLELERRRAAGERIAQAEGQAPVWEATSDGADALFTLKDGVLEGPLRNAGLVGADIQVAVLDLPFGGGWLSGRGESHPARHLAGGKATHISLLVASSFCRPMSRTTNSRAMRARRFTSISPPAGWYM